MSSVTRHYTMYHNPETMECGCFELSEMEWENGILANAVVGTNKQDIATQIAAAGGIIWCLGRECEDAECSEAGDELYLYERIENPTVERGDDFFEVSLVGTPRFPEQGAEPEHVIVLNKEPYYKFLQEHTLYKGLQLLTDEKIIADFEAEFAALCKKVRQSR